MADYTLSGSGLSRFGVTAPTNKTLQPAAAAPATTTTQPSATTQAAVAAAQTTPPTAYPVSGKVKGPYDAYRTAPPDGVSISFWNEFLDQQNTAFQKLDGGDQKQVLGFINAQSDWWGDEWRKKAQAAFRALPAEQRQQYQQQDAAAAPGGYGDPNSPQAQQQNLVNQILNVAGEQRGQDQAYVDQTLQPLLGQQATAADAAGRDDERALNWLSAARTRADTTQQQALDQQRANAANYNAQGTQLYNNYANQQNALSTQDQGTLSSYLQATNPLMQQLQATGSNAADVAAQQAALQRAIGIAGGSLNYNAAQAGYQGYNAAQAASNAADVARQTEGYNNLAGVGGGSLDYQSQAARAFADPTDVAAQRQALADIRADVTGGNAEEQQALDLIKSRTGVAPTAQEALLYELNRRTRASQDASSRAAVLNNMAARGLRSGGAQLAMMQQSGQQSAQDQLLADMAANAGAVQRAQAYTGMQKDLATAMRGQQQNALGLQGNLATAIRNASFDEAYKRGVGADTASANNQGTRLAGYQGAASTANTMRGQSDTMNMFNTGQTNAAQQFTANAGNQAAMFNAGQVNQALANNQGTQLAGAQMQGTQSNAIRSANDTMNMFKDNYAAQEATRVGNLAGQRATQGLATTAQVGARNTGTYNAGVDVNEANYGRDRDTTNDLTASIAPAYSRDSDVAGALANRGQRAFERTGAMIGSATNVANARQGAGNNSELINALKLALGQNVFGQDQNALGGT